jgi:DNA-3-methyladenine glycosylase II
MSPEALQHLHRVDPIFSELIKKIGPLNFEARSKQPPFESLVQAVAHQQLHGKAATTILKRFVALFEELRPGKKFPKPEDLENVTDDDLRGVGFSRAKVAAIRDIAAKTLEGIIPTSRQINKLDDEEIIERLTAVRGVGRWTVEMLLIFQLGRPDILPADDFGVRNGFRVTYGLAEMPMKKAVTEFGEIWRPYRTTAALYLWRAADFEKATAAEK